MAKPIIHLCSAAGSCRPLREALGLRSDEAVVELAREALGDEYRVTARLALMDPELDERRGGRRDDAARRRDIERSLGDERVRAIVALRGGAWMTRLLPEIDFDVLAGRTTPLFLFGFSEFTHLINIAAGHPCVHAYYDHDLGHLMPGPGDYQQALREFLADLVGVMEGRGSDRQLSGRLVRGVVKHGQTIRAVGGCLSVLVTLLGSRFQQRLEPRGRWLALEDVDDEPSEIDRRLAQLKLAGFFESCGGILLGDFHFEDGGEGREDLTPAVLELLRFHLPRGQRTPIIAHCNFGHCHPAAPLLIARDLTLQRGRGATRNRITIAEP